jgi:hypothetical protein
VAEPPALAIRDAAVFTRPTFRRFTALMIGLIVTMGRRTVSHALALMRPTIGLRGHWSDYHRLFSAARFSMWTLAAALVRQVVTRLLPAEAVIWRELPKARQRACWSGTPCYDKRGITFADALAAVRRELWEQALLGRRSQRRCLDMLPSSARRVILRHLAIAA